MINSVFERLTVIGLSDQKYKLMCKCTCGQIKHVRKSDLVRGRVKSCGCLLKEKSSARAVERNSSHGMSRTRVYRIWAGIIDRCTNKNGKYFEHYMGRGITICDRWKTFENFYTDMGDPPSKHSIERIDNDKRYSPTNCKWATFEEQNNNKRSNVCITFENQTLTIAQWSKRINVRADTLRARINSGWSIEKALTTP